MTQKYKYRTVGLKYKDNDVEVIERIELEGWEFVSSYGTGSFIDQSRTAVYFIFRRSLNEEKS